MGDNMERVRHLAALMAELDRTFRDDFKRGAGVPGELTLPQYRVLALLATEGPLPQRRLAAHLGVTGPTVVRVVDALERKGFAARRRAGRAGATGEGRGDRRVVRVALTAAGARVQRAVAARQERRLAAVLARLPAGVVDAVLADLAALLAGAPPAPRGRQEPSGL